MTKKMTGPKTPEGRARISAAQTLRWIKYREDFGMQKSYREKHAITALEKHARNQMVASLLNHMHGR